MAKKKHNQTTSGNLIPGAVGVVWMVISCDATKPSYYGNPTAPTVSVNVSKKAK